MDKITQWYDRIVQSRYFEIIQTPFFSLGDFNISVWMICKGIALIYFFALFARCLNAIFHKTIYPRLKLDENSQYVLDVLLKYLFIIAGIFTTINLLGIKLGAFAVFAGTVGIGIGLGIQDIAKNFISGIVLLIERPIKIGDFIEVGDLPGRVRAIKPRGTIVDTFDNTSVVVPNSEFTTQRIVNWSYSDRLIRVTLNVGVAYGSNTRLVEKTLVQVAEDHPNVLKKPKPYVWFHEFGDSSLNFKLHVWIDNPKERHQYKSDLNFAIDEAFRKNNITIPFPQRDLHIKSSDVSFKTESIN